MTVRSRRGRAAAFAIGIGASLGLAIGVAIAFNPTLSNFEIDGDLYSGVDEGVGGGSTGIGVDWAQGAAGTGALTNAGADNPAEPGTAALVQDPVSGNNDTTTFQAAKENDFSNATTGTDPLVKLTSQTPWKVVTGQSQPKDDLTNTYFYGLVNGDQADVVVAAERTAVTGESHLDFEFNQLEWVDCPTDPLDKCPVRKEGDVLVAANIDPDGVTTFYNVYVWDLPGGIDAGKNLRGSVTPESSVNCDGYAVNGTKPAKFAGCPWEEIIAPANTIVGVLNQAPVDAGPWGSRDSSNALRGEIPTAGLFEAFLDFDALGFPPSCPGFAKASVKTRASGEGISSSMSDLSGPVDINLDTCATITIVKDTVPNAAQDFAYTTSANLGQTDNTFSLDDDGVNTGTNGDIKDRKTFTVAPGTYTVQETLSNAGYALTNVVCSASGTGTTATPTVSSGVFSGLSTIVLGNNGAVTCTYTNSKLGSLTIVKDVNPEPDITDFAFTTSGAGLAGFSLDDDGTNTGTGGDISDTKVFSNLSNNVVRTVAETTNANYSLSNIVCTGATNSTVLIGTDADFDAGDTQVSVTLADGENVTCTYTNTKLGSLTIVKDVNPEPDITDFAFTTSGAGLAGFSLDDDGTNTGTGGDISDTKVFSNLSNNVVRTVAETTNANYSLSNIVCTGATNSTVLIGTDADFDAGDTQVSVTLADGENVTCTYTNTKLGSLTIVKDVNPEPDITDFAFTTSGAGLAGFSLDDDGTNTGTGGDISDTKVFSNLSNNVVRTVAETTNANYSLSNIVCTGATNSTVLIGTDADFDAGDTQVSVTLADGENVTCTYTNTKLGSLTIVKDVNPEPDITDFAFTTSGAGLAGFSLDDDGTNTGTGGDISDTKVFSNLSNNVVRTVAETTNANYSLSNIVCTGATNSTVLIGTDADFDAGDTQVSVTLADGENVTCTYTNTLQLGAIKITKTSTKGSGGLDGVTFSITRSGTPIAGSPFTTANGGIVCVENLNFADYVVTETSCPTGWLINDTTGHTITVNNNAKCSDDPFVGETTAFSDTPLSIFQILFTSLAGPGVTRANISCDVPAVTENGAPDTLTISSNSIAAATVVTTTTPHGLTTGDKVGIAGSNSTPSINGLHTVTVLSATTFRIPVNVTVAGTAGIVTPYDDTSETFGNGTTGLVPGKYTCTIDIDP